MKKLLFILLLLPYFGYSQFELHSQESDMFGLEYYATAQSYDNLISVTVRQYDNELTCLEFSECLNIDSNDVICIKVVNDIETNVYVVKPHLNDKNELTICLNSYPNLEHYFLNATELILVVNKNKYNFDISNIKSVYEKI